MDYDTLEIKAEISQLDVMDSWIQRWVEAHPVSDCEHIRERERFVFACHELVINSVEAVMSGGCSTENIRLSLAVNQHKWCFTVNDHCGGVLPAQLEQHSLDEESILEERGRGLFLIRQMTSSFVVAEEKDGSHSYTITSL